MIIEGFVWPDDDGGASLDIIVDASPDAGSLAMEHAAA